MFISFQTTFDNPPYGIYWAECPIVRLVLHLIVSRFAGTLCTLSTEESSREKEQKPLHRTTPPQEEPEIGRNRWPDLSCQKADYPVLVLIGWQRIINEKYTSLRSVCNFSRRHPETDRKRILPCVADSQDKLRLALQSQNLPNIFHPRTLFENLGHWMNTH